MKIGIKPDVSSFVWLHRLMDAFLLVFVLFNVASLLGIQWHDRYLVMGLTGCLLFIFFAHLFGIYTSWRGRTLFSSFKLILSSWFITWAILIIIAFLYKDTENFSRVVVTTWAIAVPISLMFYRVIIRVALGNYRANGKNTKNIVVIGAGKVGQSVSQTINSNRWLGMNISAYIDDDEELKGSVIGKVPVIGKTSDVASLVNKYRFDEVYICLPMSAEIKIKSILNALTDTTAIVKFVPDLFTFDLMHAQWTDLKGIPVVSVFDTPLNASYARVIKRIEDLVLSSIILILITPLLISVSIAIKLTSPGPVIFKQKRYGLNGKEIKIYKFRSMRTMDDGDTIKQATQNDSRVTSIGRFLRRSSLDELPQFVNVIQGKMSIVGPRPHACAHNEEYRKLVPKYMQRHLVKPGITGWAQVNGWRGETDTLEKMEKRVEFDLHYINHWSLWMDLKIIILTVFKGFAGTNAY